MLLMSNSCIPCLRSRFSFARITCSLHGGAEAKQAPWNRWAFHRYDELDGPLGGCLYEWCHCISVQKQVLYSPRRLKPPHSMGSVYWLICACGEDYKWCLDAFLYHFIVRKLKNEKKRHKTVAYEIDKVAKIREKVVKKSDTNPYERFSHIFSHWGGISGPNSVVCFRSGLSDSGPVGSDLCRKTLWNFTVVAH